MSLDTQTPPRGRLFSFLAPRSTPAAEPVWNPVTTAWGPIVVLGLLCAALFFYGLNIGELYRTEALRAIIAAEFLRSGDWIVPRLYGEPLVTKPPGMYAAIAAFSTPFGEVTEWTARLPSALGASAIVFLVYWYVSRHVGRLGGLVVAAVTPCGFLWLDKASSSEIDMLQVAWTAAALLFFFRAVEESERGAVDRNTSTPHPLTPSPPHPFRFWFAALLCVAGGVFTKWTAPLFFYATAIPFLLWRRQFRLLFCWQHLVSAAVGASLCFAWAGAVVQQIGWDTFAATIQQEAAPRVSYEQHLGANSYLLALAHPFRLLLVNLPWSGFALLTLWPGFLQLWDERGRRLVQAFHCWAWPNVLLFSLLPDHTTRHSFPLFPGIVALGGMAWLALLTGRLPQRWATWHVRFALVGLGTFGFLVLAACAAGFWVLPSSAWWLIVLTCIMGGWCVREGLRAYRERRLGGLLTVFVLTWVVCKFGFLHLYLPVRNINREPRVRAAMIARHVPEGDTLYLFRMKDEGIMFYYARPVRRLKSVDHLPDTGETVYCVVMEQEWRTVQEHPGWDVTLEVHMKDEQNDPMILIGLQRGVPQPRNAPPLPNPFPDRGGTVGMVGDCEENAMPPDTPLLPPGVKVLSVSELTAGVRALLEEAFPAVCVGGEISNLSRPSSGHIYLTLKDSQAQLSAVVWRSTATKLRVQVKDGMEVIARGKIAVYPPQGKYQLVIDQIYPKGLGALELAFQQLKEKLFQRGWFAEERKKPLPHFPRCIGLVTSESGAAIRDMLRIIPRRWPAADILLCPVAVQGDAAAGQIAAAIGLLNRLQCVDVMIVGRGGGSLEDLWAFNEEVVATAIFHSKIPVISAVGHEIDFTIADFVADRRAATPSEAAEIVVPDHQEVRAGLDAQRRHLAARMLERLNAVRKLLTRLAQQRVLRLPLERIRDFEQQLDELDKRARRGMLVRSERWRGQVDRQADRLQSLSPLNVLGRGYSLTRKLESQELLRSTDQLRTGDRIVTRLAQGEAVSVVESVSKENSSDGQEDR